MTIYKLPECTPVSSLPEGAVLCLGNFDGVHRGHRRLFDCALEMKDANMAAAACAWTFTTVARPDSSVPCLTDTSAKLSLFADYGLDYAIFEEFSEVCNMSATDFVSSYLCNTLKAGGVICGFNFKFGKGGEGNSDTLSALAIENGIHSIVVEAVTADDGNIISSSLVRALVQKGDMEKAGELLGHPFSVSFPVVHGQELGRTIGIPTINQSFPASHIIPARGIYACSCFVDGEIYLAVANVGVRPTVSDSSVLNCETHIINYTGDLYGREVKVEFYCRLREEMKFDSLDALRRQIKIDICATLDYFSEKYGE